MGDSAGDGAGLRRSALGRRVWRQHLEETGVEAIPSSANPVRMLLQDLGIGRTGMGVDREPA